MPPDPSASHQPRPIEDLARDFGMRIVDLDAMQPDADALAALPPTIIYRLNCVPVSLTSEESGRATVLTVATGHPHDITALDELALALRQLADGSSGTHALPPRIELVLADPDDIHRFIRTHYGVGGDTLNAMAGGAAFDATPAGAGVEDEEEQAQDASVIKLVNDLLGEAVRERATDVHIEPYERELAVRYRIDGVLQRASVPPAIHRFAPAIISRLKIMASLNIAEKRRPQDGRITFKARLRPGEPVQEFDLRVSVIPMLFGEGVVLRILSKSAVLMGLEELGMPGEVLARWTRLIDRPHGILLVTGPTGSGKSTTLYASLKTIVSDQIKAITIEDPVEYHVPGVNQIPVNPKIDLTFAAGLRAVLRHDPDVVMIGEIRDRETAEVAVQASLTGHLVFSTLHTNDAPGATTRLLDMGVEPFLVSSSVEGIMAQRLVRRLCSECAQLHEPDPNDLPVGFPPTIQGRATHLRHASGCRACRGTGYRGRVGIYELLSMSDDLRELIMHRRNAHELATKADATGTLLRLRDDAFAKARAGLTSLEEAMMSLSA